MLGEESSAPVGVQVRACQFGPDQAEKVAEGGLLAAVRGGGHEEQVTLGVLGYAAQQLVAELVLRGGGVVRDDAGVSLVDDHQVGAVLDEVVAVAGGLDEVGGDDDVGVLVEERLPQVQAALQAGDGGGEDEFGVEAELGAQLLLPLLGEGR